MRGAKCLRANRGTLIFAVSKDDGKGYAGSVLTINNQILTFTGLVLPRTAV